MAFKVPEHRRWLEYEKQMTGRTFRGESFGSFLLHADGVPLLCIALAGKDAIAEGLEPWEHVSVSVPSKQRCPTWLEMCHVKSVFWDANDCVVQYHPSATDYVNNHEYVLHLWRPVGIELPRPPAIMVGIKGLKVVVEP